MDLLSLIIFAPLIGATIIALIPAKQTDTIKGTTLIVTFIILILSLFLWADFQVVANPIQMEVNIPWVTSLGIHYHLGIDGISLLLIMLTTILMPLCVLSSWKSITTGVKGFNISLLLLDERYDRCLLFA